MARELFVLCTAMAITACSAKPAPESVPQSHAPTQVDTVVAATAQTSVTMQSGDPPGTLAGFVAAIAPTNLARGQCRIYAMPNRPTTLVVLAVAGEDVVARTVSVELDSAGREVRFSDLRGNSTINGTGPRTSVTLDFIKGTAQASNESAEELEIADGTLSSALPAANLGTPQRVVEEVRARCLHK